MEMDALDKLAATVFDGFLVRKDLVRKYARQYPIPTYVVEFLLGRYCATVDEHEIFEGLQFVEDQLKERTVRPGEQELVKSKAREQGSVKIIDIVKATLDTHNDRYLVEIPSLTLKGVRIADPLVRAHERMLTDGFYAEVTLAYDPLIAQQEGDNPFSVEAIRPIQMSKSDVLDSLAKGRKVFNLEEWIDFLMRSIGLEPASLSERAKWVNLLRIIPFVERNYNLVELGPRGTGKSHLYQQISPYSHLISGGKATVAKMFVNNATGERGLVCHYDVVCFDEISGISFDQKDGVNIMKGYMASGEFSRGKESIRADGSIVMLGNLDADVRHQQKIGHLLSPLPPQMRDDTAFMDRIHAYAPGWDFPKVSTREHLTDHFGLVSDFLSECWNKLRLQGRVQSLQGRFRFGGALNGRDLEGVNKSVSGLVKILFPDPEMAVPDESLERIVRIALEARRRVKEQQKRCLKSEFRNTAFSFVLGAEGVEQFVSTPELHGEEAIESDPLPPGQVWAISPGGAEAGPGLYRIEVTMGPGSGVRILNTPTPPAFRESVRVGEQNLYVQGKRLVGDRDARSHEFSIQMRALDMDHSGGGLGLPVLVSLTSALLERSTKGGQIVVGALNLGGSVELIANPVSVAEIAIEKQATSLLMPIAARRQLLELPDELATKIRIEFYSDAADAVVKAMME
jgi:ATP-dependent Lon protease